MNENNQKIENEQFEETVEESQNKEEIISDFHQYLIDEDMVQYNFYLIEKRIKTSFFTKIVGIFIIFLGVYSFFNVPETGLGTSDIINNCIFIVFGLFFTFALGPIQLLIQRKIIKKKIIGIYSEVDMHVVVSNEGISFSVPKEDEEINDTISEEETILVTKEENDLEINENTEEEENISQEEIDEKFTIPWGGVVNIEDDGRFMFINMVGFQSMLIKKVDCPNIEDVIAYSKQKLGEEKRYRIKKNK